MSKAFTRESEGADDDDDISLPPLPKGSKNYITPQGYAVLRDELLEVLKAVTTADDVVFYGSALHNARAAIAKATGETK